MELEDKKLKFLEKIKEVYPDNYQEIIQNLKTKEFTSFRLNTLKIGAGESYTSASQKVLQNLKNEGFEIKAGIVENSFFASKNAAKRLSESQLFNTQAIYIQDQASMIPALIMKPKANETIIDLCAAPGSKTTQIADLTCNKAVIYAVESAKQRFFALKKNLDEYGVANVNLILANSIGLDKRYPNFINFFDKVLVDAPCTNEGRIELENPKSYQFWNPKKYKELSRVQKGILITGIRLLKPGGTLVYSTCTFNPEENELVLEWLLEKFPKLDIEKIDLNLPNTIEGFTLWRSKPLNQKIKNAVRILPTNCFSGFFIAKINKPIN